ncbi:unnamed protein product [Symbiodinium natans]|uniref:DUF4116 domain-containing protein n=1 Tax=Symbiodinium natans TaxID=878477 RepID=A0A812MFM2_9DINO|nr:unnamed protein product [Symbiodinium natans]
MAARRPVLFVLAVAACLWLFSSSGPEEAVFVAQAPALRGQAGAFAGSSIELTAVESPVVLKALPEPRPNDAMLPVELNRTSLYWGLLLICPNPVARASATEGLAALHFSQVHCARCANCAELGICIFRLPQVSSEKAFKETSQAGRHAADLWNVRLCGRCEKKTRAKVTAHSLSGDSWVVDGQQGWCVGDAMKVLEEMTGVPQRDQRLLSGTQELKETDALSAVAEAYPSLILTLLVRNPEFAEWRERLRASDFPQDLFRKAPEHIRDDREIVMAVLERHGFSLKFASSDLQDCQEVVLCAVRQTGAALAYASRDLKANKGVVLAAVQQHGSSLEHACQELQNDREVVLAAVSNQGRALRYASKELQADPDIALAAVKKDAASLAFAAAEARNNRGLMEQVAEHQPHGIRHAGEDLRCDWGLWLKAVARDPSVLVFAPQELRAGREFMCLAAQRNGFALEYAVKSLQNDGKLLMIAVGQVEQQCRTESALNEQDLAWQRLNPLMV